LPEIPWITAGHVATVPWRLPEVERALVGGES